MRIHLLRTTGLCVVIAAMAVGTAAAQAAPPPAGAGGAEELVVTGVTADRFKGNANELSVWGLGPTLSFSTFNGREVSTAGPLHTSVRLRY